METFSTLDTRAWKDMKVLRLKKPEKTIKRSQQCIENFEREYRGETIDFKWQKKRIQTFDKPHWESDFVINCLALRTLDERFWNFEHAEKTSA